MYNILLVDDSAFNRKLTRLYLDKLTDIEITVYEVCDGGEVFAFLAKNDIDIIILDLIMPKKDGFAVLQEISESRDYCQIPVIVHSAIDDPAYIIRALKLGAYDYFIKPRGLEAIEITGLNLHLKVRNAIQRYSLYKQAQQELLERSRTEKALRASEERYRAIVTQSKEGIVLIDIKTKRVIEGNKEFANMLGYSEDELKNITVYDFCDEERESLDYSLDVVLLEQRHLTTEVHRYRNKNGLIFYVERTGSLVEYDGYSYLMAIIRDITAKQKLQDEVRRDMFIAANVQHGFLPPDMKNSDFEIRGLYEPSYMVSGDLYDYYWDETRRTLTGYILDISGHGVATALIGSALKSLFHQTIESGKSLSERLTWLNSAILPYCQDEFFAATFYFEIDLGSQILTYCSGGINHFIRYTAGAGQLEVVPGNLVGVFDHAIFKEYVVTISPGDYVLFFSDGIMEIFPEALYLPSDFSAVFTWLEELIGSGGNRDDISVLGIAIQ